MGARDSVSQRERTCVWDMYVLRMRTFVKTIEKITAPPKKCNFHICRRGTGRNSSTWPHRVLEGADEEAGGWIDFMASLIVSNFFC